MTGSIRVAEVFGIPVKLHWTFSLLLFWVVGASLNYGLSWEETGWQLLFVITLFLCVVLHEYGHALTARQFGVVTRDIILSPIGGIARLERLPEKPFQEFLVAIAGPLVNVAIAILLLPYFYFYPISNFFEKIISLRIFDDGLEFVPGILVLNLILAAFNMIPAFPMDGGRILRALLSLKLPRVRATQVASYLGQAFALVFILWGFLPDDFLPFGIENGGWTTGLIGVFIFFTARREYESAKVEHILDHHTVAEVMVQYFAKLKEHEPVEAAANYLKQTKERNFLVFAEDTQLVGSINEKAIIKAIKSDDLKAETLKYTELSQIPAVYASEKLKSLYDKLYSYKHPILPVLENGEIVGVIDEYILNEFLATQRKLKS